MMNKYYKQNKANNHW